MGTGNGLCRFTSGFWNYFDIGIGGEWDFKTNVLYSLRVEASDVWTGSEYGFQTFARDTPDPSRASARTVYAPGVNAFDGLSQTYIVLAMARGPDGVVWFGTEEFTSSAVPPYSLGGLWAWNGATWVRYGTDRGLPANGISAFDDVGDALWMGVFGYVDGVNRDPFGIVRMRWADVGHFERMGAADGLADANVTAIAHDGDTVVVGTDSGVWVFER